jgi:PAS domain S-box-containing protein
MTLQRPDPSWSEADRLAALDRYGILDTPPEAEFDGIVRMAAELLEVPIAAVSLIAAGRQWFKAEIGIGIREMPLDNALCAHAIFQEDRMIVPDTTKDPRFDCNPLVTGEPGLRFYAGELLKTPDGLPLGTLCVLEVKERPTGLTEQQAFYLQTLARQVMSQMELRRVIAQRDDVLAERRSIEARQSALLELGDRLRTLDSPSDMAWVAAEISGRTLGLARAGYGRLDAERLIVTVERDWTAPGLASIAGRHALENYGTFGAALSRGETVAVNDVAADPRTAGRDAAFRAIQVGALVNLGIVEDGGVAAILFLHHAAPHDWSEQELDFALGIADRTRAAVARHQAETELRLLNATLQQQVERRTRELDRTWRLSRDLLIVADADGTIAAVNAAWTDLLGWEQHEIVGRHFSELTHPDDLEPTRAAFARVFDAPIVTPYEFRFQHKDGTYRSFAWTGALEDGRVYGNGRHTTPEREQAEALARAEQQLRQAQKMEAVGQLTGGIAHDFNNLLTGIVGSLELLGARVAQGRLKDLDRYIAAAQGAAGRAAALTHRLLAFSRQQTLDPKAINVNRLIDGMEELVRRTVGPAITVEVVGSAGLWTTLVDPHQLESALLNLCINARDAMPDGGRITVETANRWLDERAARERNLPPGQFVSLCVTDTGTGMTPEVIARAFDPFFTTKPIGQGTGLGLSMIYGFVRQSGGQVRIYSEVGQGTTMCLYLPRHYGAEEAAEDPAQLSGAPRAEQGETVLIVDDEPTVRMLVTEVLEDLGYTAIEATDGAAGLQVLRSDARIDLLVTDVGLPGGMNGRQLADAGRVLRPALKVLFITGYAENALIGNGQLGAGMHVLTKPFPLEALASRIKELIAT